MNYDFIQLTKLGVGSVLLRYSEIVLMEPTHQEFTRLDLSFGEHIIVEEGPGEILKLIYAAETLKAAQEAANNPSAQ